MDRSIVFVLLALALPGSAFAQASSQSPSSSTPATPLQVEETIQITATRIPEDVLDIPASVTVIGASELAARGATDLASALSLAAGVAIAPGGDGGPASSVPELMGLRELDAFLLVVDGVPWGGAFNPALSTLDLTNVDRIEILRGAAPVLYGATSFVGVIHVLHRSPENTPREVALSGGSFGSFRGAVTSALPGGSWKQSISASFEKQGFKDDRTGFDRAHALWSANGSVGAGTLRLALDLTAVTQDPNSPHPRQGPTLTSLVPLDANHNPSDAKIDEDRFHLVAGYERPAGAATWTSTLALTRTTRDTIRGFLREELEPPPGENNADGYRQDFEGNDYYFDTHFAWQRDEALSLVAGMDLLGGKGQAMSENFEYFVAPDGSNAPSSRGQTIDERPELEDERTFAGAYLQALWKPAERWTVDAGVRLNSTREKQEGEVETDNGEQKAVDERTESRLSGGFGASFLAWHDDDGGVWLYADYKDAFKPAAIDFGPQAEGEILKPETAQTIEAGLKGSHGGGRFNWQANAYRMDFENLVIARTVNGRPSLENAGEQRFEGFEVEGKYRLSEALILQGSYAHHSAEFRDFVQEFDGVPTQLRGHTLELSPDQLGALGLTWAPERGLVGWGSVNYIGERFLNKRNTAVAGSYNTMAAGIGYRFERGEVRLDGFNLTDERDPVAESELGESQYYRLPARFLRASLTWRF